MNAEPFKRTGVFLTADQLAAVKEEFRLPVMMIGGSVPDPWKLIDRYSVEQGMPETDRQRGADLKTGEILEFVPDDEMGLVPVQEPEVGEAESLDQQKQEDDRGERDDRLAEERGHRQRGQEPDHHAGDRDDDQELDEGHAAKPTPAMGAIRSIGGYRTEDAGGYLAEVADGADGVLVVAFRDGEACWRYHGAVKLGALALFLMQAQAQVAREAEE